MSDYVQSVYMVQSRAVTINQFEPNRFKTPESIHCNDPLFLPL